MAKTFLVADADIKMPTSHRQFWRTAPGGAIETCHPKLGLPLTNLWTCSAVWSGGVLFMETSCWHTRCIKSSVVPLRFYDLPPPLAYSYHGQLSIALTFGRMQGSDSKHPSKGFSSATAPALPKNLSLLIHVPNIVSNDPKVIRLPTRKVNDGQAHETRIAPSTNSKRWNLFTPKGSKPTENSQRPEAEMLDPENLWTTIRHCSVSQPNSECIPEEILAPRLSAGPNDLEFWPLLRRLMMSLLYGQLEAPGHYL
ncbi:hypothetical protein B0H11DRAFT_1899197 [Mycena galericulata]|nr:hypothetical protein B0H11DRAFT_1899197 [Mycena galericulata]